jgi:hypothetical protein
MLINGKARMACSLILRTLGPKEERLRALAGDGGIQEYGLAQNLCL